MQIPHFSKRSIPAFLVAVPGNCSSRMNKFNNVLVKKVSFGRKPKDIPPSRAKENPPIAR
jgi:hypothetical protein